MGPETVHRFHSRRFVTATQPSDRFPVVEADLAGAHPSALNLDDVGPLQHRLPPAVSAALSVIDGVLRGHGRGEKSYVPAVSCEIEENKPFRERLLASLLQLHTVPSLEPSTGVARQDFPVLSQEGNTLLGESVGVLADHYERQIVPFFCARGFSSCSVAITKFGYADELHVHAFHGYLLYCGRTAGTAVVRERLEEAGLEVVPVNRRNQESSETRMVQPRAERAAPITSVLSDPEYGLFLPRGYAHAGTPPPSPKASSGSELCFVLIARR